MNCNIILDLMPLVKDGVASEESKALVEEHVQSCYSCKEEYGSGPGQELIGINDKRIVGAIKRRIYISQVLVLCAGTALGVAFTNSMNMFYNFIIMPLVGGAALMLLGKKWYLAPFGVFILTYLWQTVIAVSEGGWVGKAFSMGVFYSSIYAVLVIVGVMIAGLLKFAFSRDGE